MTTETPRPNTALLVTGGFIGGAGTACWLSLFYFIDKWHTTGPTTPTGDAIYPNANHGLVYFTAMQATAAHLTIPIWLCLAAGLALTFLASGRVLSRMTGRIKPSDMITPALMLSQLTGAVTAITVIFFFGHAILTALSHTRFGPQG